MLNKSGEHKNGPITTQLALPTARYNQFLAHSSVKLHKNLRVILSPDFKKLFCTFELINLLL